MNSLIGYFTFLVLPITVGLLAIGIPFRTYRRTKKGRFLTLVIINAVLCGLSISALVAAGVLNGLATYPPFIAIAAGFIAMLVLELTIRGGKKPPKQSEPMRPKASSPSLGGSS